MRLRYSLLMYLALPWVLCFLAWRGLRDRGYLQRWGERFGRIPRSSRRDGIVVHAASVGEVNAAAPLIRALLRDRPDVPLTVTTFTPTGSRRVVSLFGGRVFHVFAPLDLPGAVRRFLERTRPRLAVVMETEIWPNLFAQAHRRGLPLLMANARLTKRSAKGYGRAGKLIPGALAEVAWVGAQTPQDAERLIAAGARAERVEVVGNLKFEIAAPSGLQAEGQALRHHWGAERPVIVAGSTHAADERVLLPAFRTLLDEVPDALLILVPRHPERFAEAERGAVAAGFDVARHSRLTSGSGRTQVLVVDAMGVLMHYYAAGDIAFVGGSFGRVGGHSLVEPAALGRPVLFGPDTANAEDIAACLTKVGGGRRVHTGAEWCSMATDWLRDADAKARAGDAARRLVEDSRGALARHLAAIERRLDQ